MSLPLKKTYPPMDALSATDLPSGPEWQYEPKWDGFRCLAFGDGKHVDLMSKSQKPLTRYFPSSSPRSRRSKPRALFSTAKSSSPATAGYRSMHSCSEFILPPAASKN